MSRGTIARIVSDRGFGFIKPDEGGNDIFFHQSSLPPGAFDQLREGQAVEYTEEQDPRSNRLRAANVQPVY